MFAFNVVLPTNMYEKQCIGILFIMEKEQT